MLPISEAFVSLQGEGKLTGVPSAFIRVAGCNMRCVWCDTPEASWDAKGEPKGVNELVSWVRSTGLRHAVLTGGEPMLFESLGALAAQLRGLGVHVTIETAGTIDRDWPIDLLSLSPKLANSAPIDDPRDPKRVWEARHEAVRADITPLCRLLRRAANRGTEVQLKFVVTQAADLTEIESLLGRVGPVNPADVLLMPEGTTNPDPSAIGWVVEACRDRGYRYAHRLHIELFGHARGT